MMMETCVPCEEKKKETSQSVCIVFDMIRDIMWKIREVDGVDKQIAMATQLFKFLGGAKDLTEIATKLMGLAMNADAQVVSEDKKEDAAPVGLESLYIDQKY